MFVRGKDAHVKIEVNECRGAKKNLDTLAMTVHMYVARMRLLEA